MENGIHRDVLDLEEFDFTKLDFTHPSASFKENGVQFINMDYSNKTFRITEDFIKQCVQEIKNNGLLIDNDESAKIEVNFKNCKFSNFIIKEQNIKADILFDYDEKSQNLEIQKFIIFGSTLGGKFYINKQYSGNSQTLKINSFKLENTVFEENFKLHHTNLSEFNIEDTDFNKHADFFKSKFFKGTLLEDKDEKINKDDIGFKAINFKGLALFGDTEFSKKLIFKYVTFESFSHFRKAKLKKGLDLDYSNIQQEMNFFDVKELDNPESKNNTSQETFRIIKHNFEKIGNKIEANKYHALELDRKQNNLESENPRKWLEYIVFKIHSLSSEHSTNWLRVVLWLLIIGSITTLLNISALYVLSLPIFYIIYLLTSLVSSIETERIFIITIILLCMTIFNINSLFTNIAIITLTNSSVVFLGGLDDYLSSWQKVVLFFNKISLGYLYYQFLLSVRKDTRK